MREKTVFQCPVCQQPLLQETTRYCCDNGHSFDIAREGYVNLLLPRDTGRGKPGDTAEMLQSRKAFLEQGYYQRFSDRINDTVATAVQALHTDSNILDAGCGEGYYTWRLKDALASKTVNIYGIDVALPAIRYAAKRGAGIRFAVASSFHLPFLAESLDGIVCVFAPRDEAQFSRVLTPHGTLIVAAPGPRHLYQLRTLMYEKPELLGEKGTVTEGFRLESSESVTYEITLKTTQDLQQLVRMTPYTRHIDDETWQRVQAQERFTTEVDFNILVYRKA